ncbi:PREDICTED: T-cell surface glycoprotein CD4-like [Nanorana parkeri]|uniref:T-cell surface glycoprotein CD4-like n=1 Tax=Nanorana parkeri TaxID=125878 RepID=UPI000854C926|nr:PREDICTED: T-cell surface glycoprotein CD4-like [Nanorana parkeri]
MEMAIKGQPKWNEKFVAAVGLGDLRRILAASLRKGGLEVLCDKSDQRRDHTSVHMKNLRGLGVCLLCLQTYLFVASDEIYEAGKDAKLPCDLQGDVEWRKDNQLLVRRPKIRNGFVSPMKGKDDSRFKLSEDSTNNLDIIKVDVSDSGAYTCVKDKDTRTVQLIVLKVVAYPSKTLLASEDLTLTIEAPPRMSLTVSWLKDQKKISSEPVLKKNNVQIEDSGTYACQVRMDDGSGKTFATDIAIRVSGFYRSPHIVYVSGKRPVTIPWYFNFEVRRTPLEKDVRVVSGNITHSLQMIKKLTAESGAACWDTPCSTKVQESSYRDLSYHLKNPKSGFYQMEVVLQLETRQKHLSREVCVGNLTVSASESVPSMESNVSLRCDINCLDTDKRLCWYFNVIGREVCGPPGQKSFTKNITAVPETLGNWTCSVMDGKNAAVSTILILKVTPGFFHPSNPLLWVIVAAGVLVLLFTVVIITVVTARRRRMRRARYRAWLLENLHQHRVCECNGFAPKRLRENI